MARNFFDPTYLLPAGIPDAGDRVAPFRRNQFGASVGGPIKKDKTFFYATFEAYKELLDDPSYVGIPSPTLTSKSIIPLVIQPFLALIQDINRAGHRA